MYCPSCGNLLQKLSVTTDSGGKFDVDHCGRCGGTWFDPYEINRVPYHEVVRLAKLTVLPKETPKTLKAHLCPRCYTKLKKYQGESMARGVCLLRCSKCHGVWGTQKALEEFKKYQRETIIKYKTRKAAFPSLSVVFVPTLFLLLLFASTFITVTHLQEAREERIKAVEQISNLQTISVSSTVVSVTFLTKTPLRSEISYGTSSLELMTKEVSKKPTTQHRILLTNLKKETTFVFQITLIDGQGRKFKIEKKVFRTKP